MVRSIVLLTHPFLAPFAFPSGLKGMQYHHLCGGSLRTPIIMESAPRSCALIFVCSAFALLLLARLAYRIRRGLFNPTPHMA